MTTIKYERVETEEPLDDLEMPGLRRRTSAEEKSDAESKKREVKVEDEGEEPPYSVQFETWYFFSKSVPLGLAAFLEWGFPPLFTMITAGHTNSEGSSDLQTALGYSRVFFNISLLMPLISLHKYFGSVVPGCIGAKRQDRIPIYLKRSSFLTFAALVPLFLLQFFAASITESFLEAPPNVAAMVGTYCKLMIITACALLVEIHLETVLINLGFAKCATANSFVCGLGVDLAAAYLFIYVMEWGTYGAALTQIVVKCSRILFWCGCIWWFELKKHFQTSRPIEISEPVFLRKEVDSFFRLAAPTLFSCFCGWFIFELQLVGMAHINGISKAALAAGAIWVQFETLIAAVQQGWIQVGLMRVLVLLGKRDPSAWKALAIMGGLSFLLVFCFSVFLLVCQVKIAHTVSNDKEVVEWLLVILWVLAIHAQFRISAIYGTFLFIPTGQTMLSMKIDFVANYLFSLPLVVWLLFSPNFDFAVETKLRICVGTSSFSMALQSFVSIFYLLTSDWDEMGRIVEERANSDKSSSEGDSGEQCLKAEGVEGLEMVPVSV